MDFLLFGIGILLLALAFFLVFILEDILKDRSKDKVKVAQLELDKAREERKTAELRSHQHS